MDPDRYQQRDFKRRLTAQEAYYERLSARIQRLEGRFRQVETWAFDQYRSKTEEE